MGSHSLVCIDSGWAIADARKLLIESLAPLGCGPADIDGFLITHVHREHYTQAIAPRRELATPVSLGEGERLSLEAIEDNRRSSLDSRLRHLRLHGAASLADQVAADTTARNTPVRDFFGVSP
jgi:glyoxylase-like metal-dependent hydrolase (beta-lactamase superfamily II)